MFKDMKAPSCIQLEITNACNQKCRHCYNYWREDKYEPVRMGLEDLDFVLDECIDSKIFNVVLSGGEVFLNFDQLLYAVEKLTNAGIGVSSDTNLMLATEEKMNRLFDTGLEHVLTSLNSYDEGTNDFIVSRPGSQKKIIKGIKAARKVGVRVSVNMIISNLNKDHVYKTGEFLSQFGINKFFSTRTVPSIATGAELSKELTIDMGDELPVLDQMLQVKEDFGIPIGSLIQHPVCFLKDVEKYKDYVHRGCPARKKMVCLDVFGEGHACVHESKSHGNIFDIGLRGIWENLQVWRSEKIIPQECRKCSWVEECEGACRFSALTVFGDIAGRDVLMTSSGVMKDIPLPSIPKEVYERVDNESLTTINTLKFRDEGDFYTISRIGADIVQVDTKIGKFLEQMHQDRREFRLEDFGNTQEDREMFAHAVWQRLTNTVRQSACV